MEQQLNHDMAIKKFITHVITFQVIKSDKSIYDIGALQQTLTNVKSNGNIYWKFATKAPKLNPTCT